MHRPELKNGDKLRRLVRCAKAPKAARHYLSRWRAWRASHRVLLAARREWASYRQSPMPWCTWGPESGGDWRARNPSSSAGGRYQIIAGTWTGNGGTPYADSHPAAVAPPLEQERIARNVLDSQGLGAWVNC